MNTKNKMDLVAARTAADIERKYNIRKLRTATEKMEALLQDGIVEQGASGIWEYRKWNSGVAECWCKRTVNGTFTEQWGGLYTLDNKPPRMSYPVAFIEPPMEIVTARTPSSACWVYAESAGNGQNTKMETAMYNVARPKEVTTEQTVEYAFYVVGRWK